MPDDQDEKNNFTIFHGHKLLAKYISQVIIFSNLLILQNINSR